MDRQLAMLMTRFAGTPHFNEEAASFPYMTIKMLAPPRGPVLVTKAATGPLEGRLMDVVPYTRAGVVILERAQDQPASFVPARWRLVLSANRAACRFHHFVRQHHPTLQMAFTLRLRAFSDHSSQCRPQACLRAGNGAVQSRLEEQHAPEFRRFFQALQLGCVLVWTDSLLQSGEQLCILQDQTGDRVERPIYWTVGGPSPFSIEMRWRDPALFAVFDRLRLWNLCLGAEKSFQIRPWPTPCKP